MLKANGLRELTLPYNKAVDTTQYRASFSEITRRGKSSSCGTGLTCQTDQAFEFFIVVLAVAAKYINAKHIELFQGNIFGIALKSVLADEQVYTSWFNALPKSNTQTAEDNDLEICNAMALLEELVICYISILLM